MARCMKCGTEIENDAVLCRECLQERARRLNRAFSESMSKINGLLEKNDEADDEKESE